MKEQIIIYRSKIKAFIIILAGFALLGASYLCFTYANDQVFGWIFIIAAAFVFILGLSNLRDRKPQIILTPDGITEPYSIKEEIEWDTILRADDFFYRGQDIVRLIIPEDYKPGLIRPTWFWRFDRIYAQKGLRAMYIRTSGLEINSKLLTTIINNMVKSHPAERGVYLRSVSGNSKTKKTG